jgi:hypothetical protein
VSLKRRVVDHAQVRCLLLPAHRAERPFEETPDADRLGPAMEVAGALMQSALGLRRAAALPQVVEPGGTVESFDPKLGVLDVARDRPAIAAVAQAAQLDLLHDGVECAGAGRLHAILEFEHDWTTARANWQTRVDLGQGRLRLRARRE